ncbi:hypothetical protein LJ737_03155 [Hymenobacter sp. 15J16-1T3B]|uniref:hypothetical protein n=1 Tax=Hymenobacter sp. 15J16-1T3B TaxID=2886941 RepID=UPI001D11E0EB|nr:hypothetical protein [Hymenobacter sp. 15J16-1T3B]MCC3156216.1 hypothetical protein [Hymenobacter sp. 15J16-1T3B]
MVFSPHPATLYDESPAGARSGKVSQKDQGEAQVRKALRSLIHHVKANYPDAYAAELRGLSFQKESFGS